MKRPRKPPNNPQKTRALLEKCQLNDVHFVLPNSFESENNESHTEKSLQSLVDEMQFQNYLITKEDEPDCIPISTNINLRCKKRMQYFNMNFLKLTIDGLVDTGAISSAIH